MGDEQRDLVGSDKPYASDEALAILRAKLTGGDLEGAYFFSRDDGKYLPIGDILDRFFVMRGGNWEPATIHDIASVLLYSGVEWPQARADSGD